MWREIIIVLLGLWLLVFAFLDFESDAADTALTVYTGLVVLVIGLWSVWSIRRATKKQRGEEAGERMDFKAEYKPSGVEIEEESGRGFRGPPQDPAIFPQ